MTQAVPADVREANQLPALARQPNGSCLTVEVAARYVDRSGALRLELRARSTPLPPFEPGAHIDLFLDNGMIRSYSLMNDPDEQDRYVVGVGLDRNSRGGSAYIHEHLAVGTELVVSAPKNLFLLDERAVRSVLVAGGIGVTPFHAMIKRLERNDSDWHLHFCARSRDAAPFYDELAPFGDRVTAHFDDETAGAFLDIPALMAREPEAAHFYCCGPSPMLDAFERAATALPSEQIHLERFSSDEAPATEGNFTVELVKSGKTVSIPAGRTILEAVQAVGIDVPFSCLSGVCGSCRTVVLDGLPDHRDMILTNRERRRNDQMMICCSGSLSDLLVLDL